MTVETQAMTTRYAYSASGEYPVAFPVIRVSDVKVSALAADGEEKPLTPGSHFEVLERESGYAVVVADGAPVSVADTVLVYRQVPMTQELDLIGPGGAFNEKDIETAFDKLTMVDQQMQAVLGRSLAFPLSDAGSSTATLPNAAGRSGKIIGFNDEGALTMYAASTTATPESTYSKNVVDYGADPTGDADSTAAIMAAMAAIGTTRGLVYFPPGTYKVSRTAGEDHCLLVGSNVTLYGRNACLKLDVDTCGATAGDEVMVLKIADDTTDVVIEGLEIDGQKDATATYITGDALRWSSLTTPVEWDGTHVYNFGIWTAGSCERITIQHCHIHDFGGDGIRVWDSRFSSTAPGWRIVNCNIHDLTGGGVAFSSRVRNSTIQGCHIYQVARACIGIEQAEYVAIVGNWLANPGYGRLGQPAECITGYGSNNKHILVANNIMRDTWRGATHLSGDYITITGNHCFNCGGVGFYLECSPSPDQVDGRDSHFSVVVDGNTIEHCGHTGYYAGADGTSNGWANAFSTDDVAYATSGIRIAYATGCVVSNNTIRNQGISACGSWIAPWGGCGINLHGEHDSYLQTAQQSRGDGTTTAFHMTFGLPTSLADISVYLRDAEGNETLQEEGDGKNYTLKNNVCTFASSPSATQTVVFKVVRNHKAGNRNVIQGNTILSVFGGDYDADGNVDEAADSALGNVTRDGVGDGMLLHGVRDTIVSDNVIGSVDGYGIRIYTVQDVMQNQPGVGYICEATSNLFRGNRITGAGLDGVFATNISDTVFDGNMITGSGGNGIEVQLHAVAKRSFIDTTDDGENDNTYDMRVWDGTRLHSTGLVFRGNAIKGSSGCGLAVQCAGLVTLPTATELRGPQIDGNIIAGNGLKGVEISLASAGDMLEGLDMRGNRIENNAEQGVRVDSPFFFTVSGNIIRNNGGSGFAMDSSGASAGAGRGAFDGNTVQGNGGAGVQYTPASDEAPAYIRFTGNYVRSHTAGNFLSYQSQGWYYCTFNGNGEESSGVNTTGGTLDLDGMLDSRAVWVTGSGTVTGLSGGFWGRTVRLVDGGSSVVLQHNSNMDLGGSDITLSSVGTVELIHYNSKWHRVG